MTPKKIFVIYTGGTIGMMQAPGKKYLEPVDFRFIRDFFPEVERLTCEIEYFAFEKPIDSSNMIPEVWIQLAEMIEKNYDEFDGFVILHGTDTMSYTASALSFMLENLSKPVILTGSQLPVAVLRSDAKENFLTSLEIASHPLNSLAEVAICFDSKVLRGNRTLKFSSEKFQAFVSPHYPSLAESGVDLEFYYHNWLSAKNDQPFTIQTNLCADVGVLKFYPGIPRKMVEAMVNLHNLKGIILETYGAGNVPDFDWVIECLQSRINEGLIVVNISQCTAGKVIQERYKNSKTLMNIGVISGHDMILPAAITKLYYLLGKYDDPELVKMKIKMSLRGELSEARYAV